VPQGSHADGPSLSLEAHGFARVKRCAIRAAPPPDGYRAQAAPASPATMGLTRLHSAGTCDIAIRPMAMRCGGSAGGTWGGGTGLRPAGGRPARRRPARGADRGVPRGGSRGRGAEVVGWLGSVTADSRRVGLRSRCPFRGRRQRLGLGAAGVRGTCRSTRQFGGTSPAVSAARHPGHGLARVGARRITRGSLRAPPAAR
jgi:hypothetical protein